jgi:hypothetical protein
MKETKDLSKPLVFMSKWFSFFRLESLLVFPDIFFVTILVFQIPEGNLCL